jgi:hypothetical protein
MSFFWPPFFFGLNEFAFKRLGSYSQQNKTRKPSSVYFFKAVQTMDRGLPRSGGITLGWTRQITVGNLGRHRMPSKKRIGADCKNACNQRQPVIRVRTYGPSSSLSLEAHGETFFRRRPWV